MKFIEPPVDTDYLIDFIVFIVNTKREEGDLAVRKQLNESKEQITSIINSLNEDNIAIFINKIQSQFKEIPELDSDLTGYHNNEYLQSTLLDLQTFILSIAINDSPYFLTATDKGQIEKSTISTRPQQRLALYYLLSIIGATRNHSKWGKFTSFLTGENEKKAQQGFSNPLKTETGELRREDLQIIRQYFEDLQIDEIVRKINLELEKGSD